MMIIIIILLLLLYDVIINYIVNTLLHKPYITQQQQQ